MKISRCRSCGESIIFIKTEKGKTIPCNSTPVFYSDRGHGRDKVVTRNGLVLSRTITSDAYEADGVGYIPHWSTCDNPDRFRTRQLSRGE